jgi:hypothetical protein
MSDDNQLFVGRLNEEHLICDEHPVMNLDEAVRKAAWQSLELNQIYAISKDSNSEDGEVLFLVVGGQFYKPIEPIDIKG